MSLVDDLGPLRGAEGELAGALAAGSARRTLTGLKGSSLPLLLARLDRALDAIRPWVILTSQASEAEALAEDLRTVGAEGVEFFPDLEILPFDHRSADRHLVNQRVETLAALAAGRVRFLVTSVPAWMRKVMPPADLDQTAFALRAGAALDLGEFASRLQGMGYREVGLVQEPGDFAVKGGIVDLFTPTEDEPVRLEFFGEELESLRRFDPVTQRSTGRIDEARVLPCSQVLMDEPRRRRAVRELRKAHPEDSVLVEDLAAGFLEGIHFEGADRYSAYFVDEVPLARYLPAG